jgi:hypothetical protein
MRDDIFISESRYFAFSAFGTRDYHSGLVSRHQTRGIATNVNELVKRPLAAGSTWEKFKAFWFGKRVQPVRIAGDAQVQVVGANDDIDDLTPSSSDGEIVGSDIPKIAGKLAALARTELHINQRDRATEAVCKDWLLCEMRKRNMRRKDIAKVLPWALKFCFVPTVHEIQARIWTLTDQYQGLRQIEDQPLRRHRTWFEYFTSRGVVEERPIDA